MKNSKVFVYILKYDKYFLDQTRISSENRKQIL